MERPTASNASHQRLRTHRKKILASALSLFVLLVGMPTILLGADPATADVAITVDGKLEPAYGTNVATLSYTQDSGGVFIGQLAVIETDDTYYLGFQQAFTQKSNVYCDETPRPDGCHQNFKHLDKSDYIRFEFTGGSNTVTVPVDILRPDSSAPSGYASFVGGGDGGNLEGIDASAVEGESAMDYNLNAHGWDDFDDSPNFTSDSDHPYIYPSIVEVGLDKAALDAALGGAPDFTGLTVVVHNSPEAEIDSPQLSSMTCLDDPEVDVGQEATFTVTTFEGTFPTSDPQKVVAFLESGSVGSIESVGGMPGNTGFTNGDGAADVVVTSGTEGTSSVRAFWDLDGDGEWDKATEPATEPACPIEWIASPELSITKSTTTGTIDAGETASFSITVSNAGPGTAEDVRIDDQLPGGLDWSEGSDDCVISGGSLHCDVGDLGPGEHFTVDLAALTDGDDCGTLDNEAVASASNHDPVSDGASITVHCPELTIEKTTGTGTIDAGDTASFTITVTNHGQGTAFDVEIDDDLPGSLPWTENSGDCEILNGHLACDVGDLAPDDAFTVSVSAATPPDDCEDLDNDALASASNHADVLDTAAIDVQCAGLNISKTASNGTIDAGDTASFTITVSNAGPGTAENVRIDDQLPGGLDWKTTTSGCGISGGTLSCKVGDLGDDEELSVTVPAETEAGKCLTLDNVASALASNNGKVSDGASITVHCPELTIEKTTGTGTIDAGDTASFTITVTNDGPGTAFDVEIDDDLPGDLPWTENADECEIPDGSLHCDVGALGADESFTVTVSGATDEEDCGTLDNDAVASASNHANVDDSDSVFVRCPGLTIGKSASSGTIDAGETASFTITVTNGGPGAALGVVIDDQLPGGLDWSEGSDECAISGGNLHCDVGDLADGASFGVGLSAPTDADDCGELPNTAAADASNHDPVSDGASVTVRCPDLRMEKTAGSKEITSGETASFGITVTNDGPGTAFDVKIDDDLPGDLPWTENASGCEITDGSLHCDVGDLGAGESFTVAVAAAAEPADCGVLDNTAVAAASNHDPVSDGATMTVNCPDLTIEKTSSSGDIEAGETASYVVTLANAGSGVASDVTVDDQLPAGLDWTAENTDCTVSDGNLHCDIGDLAAGGSFSVGVSAATTRADCGVLPNVAFGEAANHVQVSDDASMTVTCPEVNPAIDIVKTADPDVGPPRDVTYTYEVTNTGDVALLPVVVTDDVLGTIGELDSLEPGESATLSTTVAVDETSPVVNVGEACGVPMIDGEVVGEEVCDTDDAEITVVLGETITRTLPRTGAGIHLATVVAALLIWLGAAAYVAEDRFGWIRRRR